MKQRNFVYIAKAESLLSEAVSLLDSAVSDEWEHLESGDCRTEEEIDKMESVRDNLQKQKAILFKLNVSNHVSQVVEQFPNALQMLEED